MQIIQLIVPTHAYLNLSEGNVFQKNKKHIKRKRSDSA